MYQCIPFNPYKPGCGSWVSTSHLPPVVWANLPAPTCFEGQLPGLHLFWGPTSQPPLVLEANLPTPTCFGANLPTPTCFWGKPPSLHYFWEPTSQPPPVLGGQPPTNFGSPLPAIPPQTTVSNIRKYNSTSSPLIYLLFKVNKLVSSSSTIFLKRKKHISINIFIPSQIMNRLNCSPLFSF